MKDKDLMFAARYEEERFMETIQAEILRQNGIHVWV